MNVSENFRQAWLSAADVVVVGSGFFGLTTAERIASQLQKKVAIIEARDHFGGNAHSRFDVDTGIEVHSYGSHLFHTNSEKIWNYVNRFTKFNDYEHRVFGISQGKILTLPVNLQTLSQLYPGITSIEDAKVLISSFSEGLETPNKNLETKAISMVGPVAYERLIKHYTQKQWQLPAQQLPSEIIGRLPIRTNLDNRYFSDKYQGLPLDGYAAWHQSMLQDSNITLCLNTNFFEVKEMISENQLIIFTGPIDKYFDYKFGILRWRTLDFELETLDTEDFQGAAVINYCDEAPPYTRIHEFKHLHPERTHASGKTVVMKEYSRSAEIEDEPYYPINTSSDREILQKYREFAKNLPNVIFGGRLGSYQYLDMHMAIGSALTTFENEIPSKLSRLRT